MFDRVIANEHRIYVRIYMYGGNVQALAIITDNDVLQMKYVVSYMSIALSSTSIGDPLHIVIKNVKTNMGTSLNDADMTEDETTITINDGSDSGVRGTWTSTIVPKNVTVELNCEVVDNSTDVIVAKCDSEIIWGESVFNRLPILIHRLIGAQFGRDGPTNCVMFGTATFSFDGSVPGGWNEYNVTGSGSNLTIGEQFTIKNIPTEFVSHWVDTIHAKAYMGQGYAILVPPDQ